MNLFTKPIFQSSCLHLQTIIQSMAGTPVLKNEPTKIPSARKGFRRLVVVSGLTLFSSSLFAQSVVLQAIDFPDIAEGAAPYYIDDNRSALAIDAAIVEYRNKFARAVDTFEGESGFYDLSLVTLGEIDGEGEYRVLINGTVIGHVTNERVERDWGEQVFVFDNIELHPGYQIAVEAMAVSNGLIPENDEYAFARGRWRSLEINLAGASSETTSISDLEFVTASREQKADGTVAALITVINPHTSDTATGTSLTAVASDGHFYRFLAGEDCSCQFDQVVCSLPDLAPGETYQAEIIVAEPFNITGTEDSVSNEAVVTDSDSVSLELELLSAQSSSGSATVLGSLEVDLNAMKEEPTDPSSTPQTSSSCQTLSSFNSLSGTNFSNTSVTNNPNVTTGSPETTGSLPTGTLAATGTLTDNSAVTSGLESAQSNAQSASSSSPESSSGGGGAGGIVVLLLLFSSFLTGLTRR